MSDLISSNRSPRTNPLAASLRSKYSLIGETSKSKDAPSSRRLISLESNALDEIGNTDYFSRSKQLLISSTTNFRVPQLEPPSQTTPSNELQSSIKSPSKLRSSFSSTARNKVKFDLENTTQSISTSVLDRFRPQESSKSPERPSRVELERETYSSRINPMASAKQSFTGKIDRSSVIGDIASRINTLEQRMDFDSKKLSTSLSQFPAQASSRTQNNASILRTEASTTLEPKDEDIIPRKSRLRFFGGATTESFTPNETVTVTSQDGRGAQDDGEIKYSKSYVENLRRTHKDKVEDLEDRLRNKQKELESYRAESSSRIDEFRGELSRTTDRHGEEIRKVQRELDFETSKRIQENDFEIKTLKNKVRDLEEQLGSANRKVEGLQKELRFTEASNKDLSTDQRSNMLKFETELASIQEQGNIKIQQLTEKYDKERKRLKESYERLVEEISNDNKQAYKKLNEEVGKREKRIKELERENEHIQRDLYSKIENSGHDNQILYETNRSQKKNLEESREEVLRLTAQLDDKKREVHILETQVELLRTEKSRYEGEWLKGSKSPLRKMNASSTKSRSSKGFTSPK